jgi:hypothetical protein
MRQSPAFKCLFWNIPKRRLYWAAEWLRRVFAKFDVVKVNGDLTHFLKLSQELRRH